jgi:hypothetical protein
VLSVDTPMIVEGLRTTGEWRKRMRKGGDVRSVGTEEFVGCDPLVVVDVVPRVGLLCLVEDSLLALALPIWRRGGFDPISHVLQFER